MGGWGLGRHKGVEPQINLFLVNKAHPVNTMVLEAEGVCGRQRVATEDVYIEIPRA